MSASEHKPVHKRKRAQGTSERGKKNSQKLKKIHVDIDSIFDDTQRALATAGACGEKLVRSPRMLVESMQRMLRREYPQRAADSSEIEG